MSDLVPFVSMDTENLPALWQFDADYSPKDHLMQIKGKDYLNVQQRLYWFIRDQRQFIAAGLALMPYVIRTELVEHDKDGKWAQFRTFARDVFGNESTMYGSEAAKDFGDYLEKASTKSLGRALLNLGYGTAFAPELDEDERVVDAPRDAAPKPTAPKPAPEKAPAKPAAPTAPVTPAAPAAPASVAEKPTTPQRLPLTDGAKAFLAQVSEPYGDQGKAFRDFLAQKVGITAWGKEGSMYEIELLWADNNKLLDEYIREWEEGHWTKPVEAPAAEPTPIKRSYDTFMKLYRAKGGSANKAVIRAVAAGYVDVTGEAMPVGTAIKDLDPKIHDAMIARLEAVEVEAAA